jgi:hypothetical protein
VSCATCPSDWTQNWYLYDTKGGRAGNWASYGAGIDFGYSRHASFLGTSRGVGLEGELGLAVSGTINVDPNAQPLAGPLSHLNATAWQMNVGVGIGGGYFLHHTQTNKIPYSRIQPYVTAPQRAWQWATGP